MALGKVAGGLGACLAAGIWPGAVRADNARPSSRFRFVVINDTHRLTPECNDYLAGAIRLMKQQEPKFCLHCGDLTDKGRPEDFAAVETVFASLEVRTYVVIGNHDYLTQSDRAAYDKTNPGRSNYTFRHRGWQFIGLDTTDGQRYEKIAVQPTTLRWLDETLPRLNPRRPTVVFTHFPLGADVNYRPTNAEDLLYRFRDFNLQAVFSGHYHARTERTSGQAVLTTNVCCALKRDNHDGTKAKGFFVCDAADGKLQRTFVEYRPG